MQKRQQILLSVMMFVLGHAASGQQPVVFSADRSQGAMREIVTLHGSDFGDDPAVVKVFFGGAKAEIKTISHHLMVVRTPSGTTFDPVSVTNTTSGRTGYAPGQFFLNYKGEHGISSPEFSPQSDFQGQSGLYDLCLCDLNGDSKTDVATASNNSNLITLFQNASTPGNINLIGQNVQINARTLHVRCGDLNGDGRPDIVLSEGSDGDRIFILQNNGGFNFSLQRVEMTGIKVKQVAIGDLDIDGRPEIVVTNTGGNTVTILPNQSTVSAISFGDPVPLPIAQASSTDAIAIGDLNDDGLPEIVTSQYQADNENKLFIGVNKGSFNFSDVKVIAVNKALSNIRIADLDGDTKPDIAVARLTGSDISIYPNESGADISFGQPFFFITGSLPVGMDFSDFDGDGKLDIAVGSIAKSISVLNNIGNAPGTASFASAVKLSATYINRNLRNADMDGDGKPDIVFTSVDDFSGVPVPSSKVSVIRNLSCMVPELTPGGPLNICSGTPLRLEATSGGGVIYQWNKTGSVPPLKTGLENFLDIATSGEYTVTALDGSGACSKVAMPVQVTFTTPATGLTQTASDARSNSPVCTDNTLQLEVNDVGASEYRWRGPDGFSGTVTTPGLSRESFTLKAAGLYVVEMMAGTCVAGIDSTLVEAVTVPDFSISFSGEPEFCSGSGKQLAIVPRLSSGFAYQWHERNEGALPEATFDNYTAGVSGEYYAVITPDNPGCLPRETPPVTLTALSSPVADFSGPDSGCVGEEILFSQQSTGDPLATKVYQWTFGDSKISGEENPVNIYQETGSFEVNLQVSYDGVESCDATLSKMIDVFTAVTPQISASALSMCEGESLALSISGTFANITWNNSETSSAISIYSPGDYSVSTLDEHGCASGDQITIEAKPVPVITISSDRQAIAAGQSVQLDASGADVYSWAPGKNLNDSTISNPTASPLENTLYVVRGSLAGGCSATASISIEVSGEWINIIAPILFSPNGDGVNDMWIIEGIENYPDCSLNIFDNRGGRVFGTVGYENNWNGTSQGTLLPEGVYYYVLGCPNKKVITGTVTVIR